MNISFDVVMDALIFAFGIGFMQSITLLEHFLFNP
jgi:hypothetical protein